MKVEIIKADDDNWYQVGETYDVSEDILIGGYEDTLYHPLLSDSKIGIEVGHFKILVEDGVDAQPMQKAIDSHYSTFIYTLSEKNKKEGTLKVDPYFVAKQWGLGKKDDTGVLFHCLKNISRYSDKNTKEREIKALYLQVKRLAELENVNLE